MSTAPKQPLPPNPDVRTPLERLVRRSIFTVRDVAEGEALFGDKDRTSAFFVNGRQMANFVGTNTLAVRLGRKRISEMRSELRADDRVDLLRQGGDWIGMRFASRDDVARVVELVSLVAADCRPIHGATVRPPPVGVDLARRQRFH